MTTTIRAIKRNVHSLNGFRRITLTTAKGQDRKSLQCEVEAGADRFFQVSREEAANCIRYARLRA